MRSPRSKFSSFGSWVDPLSCCSGTIAATIIIVNPRPRAIIPFRVDFSKRMSGEHVLTGYNGKNSSRKAHYIADDVHWVFKTVFLVLGN
jgi:hypothetical protein